MLDTEYQTSEIACPKCGDPAGWTRSDSDETEIEVECAECGRFAITAEQLEEALEAYADE